MCIWGISLAGTSQNSCWSAAFQGPAFYQRSDYKPHARGFAREEEARRYRGKKKNVGSPAKPHVPVASLRCSWVRMKCLQSPGQQSWIASWKDKMVLHSFGPAFLFLLLDLQQFNFTDAVLTGVTLFLLQTLQLLGSWQSCHALWPGETPLAVTPCNQETDSDPDLITHLRRY